MKNNERFILTTGTITTMESFAENIKYAMENYFGDECVVILHRVTTNNGLERIGLMIKDKNINIAPTIYLDDFYNQYSAGKPLADICKEIIAIYQTNKVTEKFDIEAITEFERVRERICYKVVSAERNKSLLENAPHIVFHDLAIIFYIVISQGDKKFTGTVKNYLMEMWNVDKNKLLELAIENTQRLFKGKITSMVNVVADMIAETLEQECAMEFYDMAFVSDEVAPMYVVSNYEGMNGAGVIFYPGFLKEFADRVNSNFYIIPSSIHECILIPTVFGAEPEIVRGIIGEVNGNVLAENEVLSDNLYFYDRVLDRVEIV